MDYGEGLGFQVRQVDQRSKKAELRLRRSATISLIVVPVGTGTPTKKIRPWSPGARKRHSTAAMTPVIAAIRGFGVS